MADTRHYVDRARGRALAAPRFCRKLTKSARRHPELRKALSSLMTEDAFAYRAFLRQPRPARRWIGPSMPRSSPQWRPFQGSLSARSAS